MLTINIKKFEMVSRPVIKLKLTTTDKIIEWLGWFLLAVLWVMVIWNFSALPETIPIHWNFKGEVDNYGGKHSILIMPVVGSIVFAGMTVLNNYPHIFNYPVKINESNATRQYTNATRMIRVMKTIVVFIFLFIIFKVIQSVNKDNKSLQAWVLPFVIGIIIIPVAIFIFNSFRTTNKSAN